MSDLTDRQQQVLDCVRDYIAENGYGPSYRDIGERLGIASTNAVRDHLIALERKGRVELGDGKPRAIRVLGQW